MKIDPKNVDLAALEMITAMAMESAFQTCAAMARQTAETLPDDISGRDALMAFSAAILSTNAKVWPAEGET